MVPHNSSSPEEHAKVIIANIQAQLDQLPESCIDRILPDLQAASARIQAMVDGTEDCQQETQSEKKKTLVNNALAMSNIALRKSQEQLRVALANTAVAVFQTDLELRYTWFYSPILGLSKENLIGKRDDEVFPKDSVAELLDTKWMALKNEVVVRRELVLDIGGQQHTLIVTVEPYYGQGKRLSGVIGSFLDVTEQRRLEARELENTFKLEVNRRLLERREQERQLIARLIHDGPIQNLSSLGFEIQLARELSPNPEVSVVLEQLGDGVRSLVGELREVTNELRPAGLIRFGLTNAIRICAIDFEKRHPNISVKLKLAKAVNQVPEDISLALFRIFQESMVNISRHARASEVTVELVIEQEQIFMKIKDNGQGFELPRTWVDFTRQGRYGLVLMKERADSVGGKMEIQSCRQEGTVIHVNIQRRSQPLIPVTGEVERGPFIR